MRKRFIFNTCLTLTPSAMICDGFSAVNHRIQHLYMTLGGEK